MDLFILKTILSAGFFKIPYRVTQPKLERWITPRDTTSHMTSRLKRATQIVSLMLESMKVVEAKRSRHLKGPLLKQRGGEIGYEDELGGKTCRTVIGYNQRKTEEGDSSVSTIKPGSDVEALADLLRDTSHISSIFSSMDTIVPPTPKQRSVQECLAIYRHELVAKSLSDEEIITLVQHKHIPAYQLEKAVGDMERGVAIR